MYNQNNYLLHPQIEKIAHTLWAKKDFSKANYVINTLQQMVSCNIADAYYILARCHLDPSYIDPRFGFKYDEDLAKNYLNKSILYGSPLGMFASRRLIGYMPPNNTFVHPPFKSEREIWETVLGFAKSGSTFCKYLVANCIMYQDLIPMLNFNTIDPNSLDKFLKLQILALNFYDTAIKDGYSICQNNKATLLDDIIQLSNLLGYNGKKIIKKRTLVK